MDRRSFLKIVTAAVALQSAACFAQEADAEGVDGEDLSIPGDGSEDEDDLELVFDGTGIQQRPPRVPTLIHAPHPLWLRRDSEVFRIDVGTVEGYKAAQWALRDVKAGKTGFPDIRLLKLLSKSQVALASLSLHSRYDITSGLRTPWTNSHTEGAKLNSLHLPDKESRFYATDFRARGFDAKFTAKLMRMVGMGGIGLYWKRDFVHADTGRDRHWSAA